MDNKSNVVVPTATATSTLTETHKAVFTAVGVISSFFVGMAFMFALARVVEEPELMNNPLVASDVVATSVSRQLQYVTGFNTGYILGENGTNFGSIHVLGRLYDGAASQTITPVSLQLIAPHDAIVIALATNQGTVNVCVPQNIVNTTPRYVSYYIDENGNTYSDKFLSHRVNAADCKLTLAKSFAPAGITGGTTKVAIPTEPSEVYFFRGLNNYVASGPFTGTITQNNVPVVPQTSTLPLNIYAYDDSHATQTLPSGYFSVTTPSGSQNLCFPQTSMPRPATMNVAASSQVVYFYDNLGNPYSDPFLQNKVTCQLPTPPACTCVKGTESCCASSSASAL